MLDYFGFFPHLEFHFSFRFFESLANKPGSRQGFHASAPALNLSDDDKEASEKSILSSPKKSKHVRKYLDSIETTERNIETSSSLERSSEFSTPFLNSKQPLYQATNKILNYAIDSIIDLSTKYDIDLADMIDTDSVHSHYYDISISNPVFV